MKRVFDPMMLSIANAHNNLYTVIFDKLYLFMSNSDSEFTFEILEKFKEYISLFGYGHSMKLSPSLILLCQKFNYNSKTLSKFFFEKYLSEKFLIRSLIQPFSIKKNKSFNRNLLINACHLLGVCE